MPVSNYTISFRQVTIFALFGSTPGIDTSIKTDINGVFNLVYASEGNTRNINLYGTDSLQFAQLNPSWYGIKPLNNVDLNTIFLYKRIDTLVRKLQFVNPLNTGEELTVITSNSPSSNFETVLGPITNGTSLTVDTILNCKLTGYFFNENRFSFSASLSKPSYFNLFDIPVGPGDEKYREIMLTY